MNRKISRILFLLSLAALPLFSFAQEEKKEEKKSPRAKREEKKKERDARKAKAAEMKGRKHHEQLQTKEVRKRMKKSRKVAQRNNDNKRKPIWERMFSKKKRK